MALNPISITPPGRSVARWELLRAGRSAQPVAVSPLDPSQQAVVDHRSGALLVLAGPGTGKTHTLTEAVIARLNEGVAASEILVLTFARKAATEIRERVMQRIGGGEIPAVSTFHSLALALLREFGTDAVAPGAMTLLTGPEQEIAVRDIIASLVDEAVLAGKVSWPDSIAAGAKTRGLAVEIRNAMARAQSLGLDAQQLHEIASVGSGSAEWQLVAALLDQYADSTDQRNAIDYNELINRVAAVTARDHVQRVLHTRYKAIFIDEFQDTDPLQIKILQNLVGPSASLIAVGDPDQSIYAFRGADTAAIRDFREAFKDLNPQVATLSTTRRFGEGIRAAAYAVIQRNSNIPGLTKDEIEAHRSLRTLDDSGEVHLHVYESAEAEAEMVAEQIRKLVSESAVTGTPLKWRDIAVLVRSGTAAIPRLERALVAAGVPVRSSFDDVPLAQEPAVAVLLSALETAEDPSRMRRPEIALSLLTSPLCGLDAAELRRLGRFLRERLRKQDSELQWSEQLIADLLADARHEVDIDDESLVSIVSRIRSLRTLLQDAATAKRDNRTVEEILWVLWSGTSWPQRLRRTALAQNAHSARANRDLDSVMVLFDVAKGREYYGKRGRTLINFLALIRSMQFSSDTRVEQYLPDAVSVMTAHRSKGLEWPVVFICGLDEEVWPDVRKRSSIFQPEKLRRDGLGALPERHEVIAEERRLFFVACTRAKQKLFVSTTAGDRDSGRTPSRFLQQLAPAQLAAALPPVDENTAAEEPTETPRFSTSALVAQLRRVATDEAKPAALRQAATQRLAKLARLVDLEGKPVVPAAHPASWWGIAGETVGITPIDDPARAVYIRGSSLQRFQDCSLTWFLSQRAVAEESRGGALTFGSVVHAVADAISRGEVAPDPASISAAMAGVWDRVTVDGNWLKLQQQASAVECLHQFVIWREAKLAQNTHAGSEVDFDRTLTLRDADGVEHAVRLKGQIDIVQITADDGIFIADLKTGSSKDSKDEAQKNLQLGVYQTAVLRGLLKDAFSGDSRFAEGVATPAGAELVYIQQAQANGPTTRAQNPVAVDADGMTPAEQVLVASAARVRSEDFFPQVGNACTHCSFKSSCPLKAEGQPVIA